MHWITTILTLIPLLDGKLTECEGEYCCPEMKGIVLNIWSPTEFDGHESIGGCLIALRHSDPFETHYTASRVSLVKSLYR